MNTKHNASFDINDAGWLFVDIAEAGLPAYVEIDTKVTAFVDPITGLINRVIIHDLLNLVNAELQGEPKAYLPDPNAQA